MSNEFKDNQGRFRTVSLFLELDYDEQHAIYSLKDHDCIWRDKEYKSLKLLYLECADPTEYSFAEKYFYSWAHWQKVRASSKIRNYVQAWQDELEIKLKSQGVLNMIATAGGKGSAKDAVAASKWLSDKGWDKRRAGTPSNAEVTREKKIYAGVVAETEEDFERMGLKIN